MSKMKKCLAAALALALAAVCLAACSGGSGSGGGKSGGTPTAEDIAGWTTVGDAMATATDFISYSGNDDYIVTCFYAGDAAIRAVGTVVPGFWEKVADLDFFADDHDQQLAELAKMLPLVSAENFAGTEMTDAEMEALVGKTGRDLIASGMEFESYWFYGGDETGTSMSKGYFSYSVTFNVSITEDDTEDEGASIMDAVVTEVQLQGFSDSSMDPDLV